ncbi:MAG TPA: hypothetical protein VHW67_05320 [Solirubrobacteraceae bacterium]|jgi:hypothetical protein|nr:hypothetical protein [Solirubrobacteraceae bacterium]
MTSRFASNLAVLLLSAFLAAASFAFVSRTVSWLALAVGVLTTLTVLVAFAMRERGLAQRVFDMCMLLVAGWTIVCSRVFAGTAEDWLAFASAATLVLLASVGLVVHEVLVEIALRRSSLRASDVQALDHRERSTLGTLS